jgi:hypothetical protein
VRRGEEKGVLGHSEPGEEVEGFVGVTEEGGEGACCEGWSSVSESCGQRLGVEEREVMAEKRLTMAEKYRQLKAQTERAGMKVEEKDGRIVVTRKKSR